MGLRLVGFGRFRSFQLGLQFGDLFIDRGLVFFRLGIFELGLFGRDLGLYGCGLRRAAATRAFPSFSESDGIPKSSLF